MTNSQEVNLERFSGAIYFGDFTANEELELEANKCKPGERDYNLHIIEAKDGGRAEWEKEHGKVKTTRKKPEKTDKNDLGR